MTENERRTSTPTNPGRTSDKCGIGWEIRGDILDGLEKIEPDVPEEDRPPFVTDIPDGDWTLTVRFFITKFNERVRGEDRTRVLSEFASFVTDAFSVDAEVSPVTAAGIFSSDDDSLSSKLVFGLNPRPGLTPAGAVRMLRKLDSLGTLVLNTCDNRFSGQFPHIVECRKSRDGFEVIDFDNTGHNVADRITEAVRRFREPVGKYSFGFLRSTCFRLCGIDSDVPSAEADGALMRALEKADMRRPVRRGHIVNRN